MADATFKMVSRKVEYAPQPPSVQVHRLDRSDSPPSRPRWNVGSFKTKDSGVASTGGSLLSLKSYYRKLRTFKGTIKALINLRKISGVKRADESIPEELETPIIDSRRATTAVTRVMEDSSSLDTLQDQVHSLVKDGHVVAEFDRRVSGEVSYRQQGNLEHYTEENLMKRIALQRHPHLVALTQRLWICATQTGTNSSSIERDSALKFSNYEAFMLRLHRLILPEFDIAASRELIQDDWLRDAGGKDHLDYLFFHLSMFELVDLWTDTVDEEDYISLLYCIMHSLTFAWGDRHFLKPLEDIELVDILEESKEITMEEITANLKPELESAEAELFRDQIAANTSREQSGVGTPTDQNGVVDEATVKRRSESHTAMEELDKSHADVDSEPTTMTAASNGSAGSSADRVVASESSQATLTQATSAPVNDAKAKKGEDVVDLTDSTPRRQRSRAQSASVAARRTNAFKRHTLVNSRPQMSAQPSAGAGTQVVYDATSLSVDPRSASPLMVKSYGQQRADDIAASPRGFAASLDGELRLSIGTVQMDGLRGSSLEPAVAMSRPSGLVADRSPTLLVGRELAHGLDGSSQSAKFWGKADSPRAASSTFDELSSGAPPLQIGSFGGNNPLDHVAVKPTTYILKPYSESPRTPRPQTSSPRASASTTSPRASSASYKRNRQPSVASTVHRPSSPPPLLASSSPRSGQYVCEPEITTVGSQPSYISPVELAVHRPSSPPSLLVSSSPRNKLNVHESDIAVMRRQPSYVSSFGSVQQQPRGAASGGIAMDCMHIMGRAATPRSGVKASVAARSRDLGNPPTSQRSTQRRSDGLDDLSGFLLEAQHEASRQKPSTEQRGSTLSGRPDTNQAANTSTRRVSMGKLCRISSRRVPAGSRSGSSRLPATLSVRSLAVSPRHPSISS